MKVNKRYTSQRGTTSLKSHRGQNKTPSNILYHCCLAKHQHPKVGRRAGRGKKGGREERKENVAALARTGGVNSSLTMGIPGPVLEDAEGAAVFANCKVSIGELCEECKDLVHL